MSNLQVQRPHSQSLRRKRPQSALNEEVEIDAKAYRYLLSLLVDNINLMGRAHRECLGEMQQQAKIKISRQEQQAMSDHMFKIYCRFEDKLTRQLFSRNIFIKKAYSQFYECYRQSQNEPEEQNINNQLLQQQNLINENNFIIVPPAKKLANFFESTPPNRPMSSRFSNDMNTLNQAIAGFNKTAIGQIYKMKTISAHVNYNPEIKDSKSKFLMFSLQKTPIRDEMFRAKKPVTIKNKEMLGQKRYNKKDYQEFNFNGNQIIISENKLRNKQSAQNENKLTSKTVQISKMCTKRILNLKYSQRKSIDQIEKMQIQSRIMMVNSVLSVNLPQSQGYRPKSKCWLNYFN